MTDNVEWPGFPGASTRWGGVGATYPGDMQHLNAGVAQSEAITVGNWIEELRGEADGIGDAALAYVAECAAFAVEAQSVSYSAPIFQRAVRRSVEAPAGWPSVTATMPAAPGAVSVEAAASIAPYAAGPPVPSPSLSGVEPGAVPAAASLDLNIADLPEQSVTVPDAPAVSISVQPLPAVPSAPVAPDVASLQDSITPVGLTVPTLDDGGLDDLLNRLRQQANQRSEDPGFTSRMAQALALCGSMLDADPLAEAVLDANALREDGISRRYGAVLGTAFSRRGLRLDGVPCLSALADRQRARQAQQQSTARRAAQAQFEQEARQMGVRLCGSVYAALIDQQARRLEVQLDIVLANADSVQAWVRSAELAYQGAVAVIEAGAEGHAATLAAEEARAQTHRSRADAQGVRADLNDADARAFMASERAKGAGVDLAEARGAVEDAKVRAHQATMQGVRAKADALGVRLEQYRARVAQWQAGAEQTTAQVRQFSTRARAIGARNAALAQQVDLTRSRHAVTGAQLQQAAEQVRAQVQAEQAQSQARRVQLERVAASNDWAATGARVEAVTYDIEAEGAKRTLRAPQAILGAIRTENAAAARFFTAASSAATNAARLTQAANIELANAYDGAQRETATNWATIEAGRRAGWNAHVTLRASGDLDASLRETRSVGQSYTTSVGESDTESQNVETN